MERTLAPTFTSTQDETSRNLPTPLIPRDSPVSDTAFQPAIFPVCCVCCPLVENNVVNKVKRKHKVNPFQRKDVPKRFLHLWLGATEDLYRVSCSIILTNRILNRSLKQRISTSYHVKIKWHLFSF